MEITLGIQKMWFTSLLASYESFLLNHAEFEFSHLKKNGLPESNVLKSNM